MIGVDRRLAYLLAWAVAAAVTVSIAWLGIRSVLAAATPTRPVPLSAAQLRRVVPLTPPDSSGSSNPSARAGQSRPGPAIPADSWVRDGSGFKRTFHIIGGDVNFFAAPGSVEVTSTIPKQGYTANVTRYGADSVMVSFFGNRKTSRVWARWWNGPYAEITESVT